MVFQVGSPKLTYRQHELPFKDCSSSIVFTLKGVPGTIKVMLGACNEVSPASLCVLILERPQVIVGPCLHGICV